MDPTDLFLYGTLQDPDVLGALVDDPPRPTPVTVPGWRVAPVRGQVFPGLVPDEEAVARGHHVRVTASQLDVLDRFEGPGYDRRPVGTVHVGGEMVEVQAWVVPPGRHHVCEPGTWTLEGFRADPGRDAWLAAIQRGHDHPTG